MELNWKRSEWTNSGYRVSVAFNKFGTGFVMVETVAFVSEGDKPVRTSYMLGQLLVFPGIAKNEVDRQVAHYLTFFEDGQLVDLGATVFNQAYAELPEKAPLPEGEAPPSSGLN